MQRPTRAVYTLTVEVESACSRGPEMLPIGTDTNQAIVERLEAIEAYLPNAVNVKSVEVSSSFPRDTSNDDDLADPCRDSN